MKKQRMNLYVQKNTVIKIKSNPQTRAIENHLIEKLGTKVKLRPGKKGGSIEISYFSSEDLDRILDLFESLS